MHYFQFLFYWENYLSNHRLKVKVWTLVVRQLTWVKLVTRSAVLQSPKWTHGAGAASRHITAPISHTRPSPGYPYICCPAEGRRLSWQLAHGCVESNPQPLSYECDTLPLDQLHPPYSLRWVQLI